MHTCAYFCYKMVHCGIWDWCIVGFVQEVYYTLINLQRAQKKRPLADKSTHWTLFIGLTFSAVLFVCQKGSNHSILLEHDDVIKWKHFPRYWPFVRGIHRSPVNSPHKGQWRGALMFSLICVWMTGWVNNHEAGDLRRHRAHYDVIVMTRQILGIQMLRPAL